jgi:hypothetical protein
MGSRLRRSRSADPILTLWLRLESAGCQVAGGPLKPGFGLSGVVPDLDRVFPLLVRAFAPSSLKSRPVRHSPVALRRKLFHSPLKPKPGLSGPPASLAPKT